MKQREKLQTHLDCVMNVLQTEHKKKIVSCERKTDLTERRLIEFCKSLK